MSSPTSPGTQLPEWGDEPALTQSMDNFLDQLAPEHLRLLHDRLWDRFSPGDRIQLRNKLRSKTIRGFCQLEHLPDHVFLYLIEFLQPRDLVRAAQVNRTWRNLFTSNEVFDTACSRLFPGLLQSHLHHRADAGRGSLFRDACRNFALWRPEAFEILKHEPMVTEEDLFADLASRCGYTIASGHGRLARQNGRDTIVVNLRDGSEKSYRIPYDQRKGRPSFVVAAGSKDCVVVSELRRLEHVQSSRPEHDHSRRVLDEMGIDVYKDRTIWFLNLNVEDPARQWKSKTLPSRLENCYVDSSSVIATCQNGQAFHWQWGGPLEELPRHQELQPNSGSSYALIDQRPAAMFHPRGNVCYLVYMLDKVRYRDTEDTTRRESGPYASGQIEETTTPSRLRVVEYMKSTENSWIPSETTERDLELPDADFRPNIEHCELRCTKADNNGTFNLAIYTCAPDGFSSSSDSATLFNVFTGSFSTVRLDYEKKPSRMTPNPRLKRRFSSAPFPKSYGGGYDLFVWNRGIYKSHSPSHQSYAESQEQMIFDVQRPATDGLRWESCAAKAGEVFGRDLPQRGHLPPKIYVDDDHVVLAYSNGYTAYTRRIE